MIVESERQFASILTPIGGKNLSRQQKIQFLQQSSIFIVLYTMHFNKYDLICY